MPKINLNDIHLGKLIHQAVIESKFETSRICNFLNCSEVDIKHMYEARGLDTETVLRWSKLLEYDFFRIYSQHLILYAPQGNKNYKNLKEKKSQLPLFRKNIYTKEIIEFILERISKGEMTKLQVINEYKIPKTTLYKWIEKYGLIEK